MNFIVKFQPQQRILGMNILHIVQDEDTKLSLIMSSFLNNITYYKIEGSCWHSIQNTFIKVEQCDTMNFYV